MSNSRLIVLVGLLALRAPGAEINGVADLAKITAPSAPPTSFGRLYIDSATSLLGCKNSDGSSCLTPATTSLAFSAITSGTNTTAAMVVGVGSTFTINQSGAAAPTMPVNSNFGVIGVSATSTRIANISYANTAFFTAYRLNGTPGSPAVLVAADQIGGVNAFGYDGTATPGGPVATFRTFANETWSNTAHGAYADIATTPNGTTTLTQVMQFNSTGNVLIGGSTEGNYRLDVQKSGSVGTARFFNQTATTGTTSVLIKGGAGNATSDKLIDVQNNSSVSNFSATMAGDVTAAGFVQAGATVFANGSNGVRVNTKLYLRSLVDGNAIITNNGQSDFGLLQFGGTTSSFPALKRSAATLQVRLADDSAFSQITSNNWQGATILTVATLPTCNAGAEGTRSQVSDALGPTFLVIIVGGGAVHTPVYCNGTNWIAS